jgi:hypothetical protein
MEYCFVMLLHVCCFSRSVLWSREHHITTWGLSEHLLLGGGGYVRY